MPAGLLVVPTKLLVAPGTAGVYYLSLQTANLSGTANTTFELFEGRTLAMQLTANGSAINANTKAIVAQSGAIPDDSYEGPATLVATTTVTPQGGGSPVILTASTQLFVLPPPTGDGDRAGSVTGGANSRVAQGFVGFGIPSGPTAPEPCAGGDPRPCYGVPNSVAVLALDLMVGPSIGGVYYVVAETTDVKGSASTLYELVEDGKVAMQFTTNDESILPNRTVLFGAVSVVPAGTYTGPATLIAATTVITHYGDPITVKGGITLQIIQ